MIPGGVMQWFAVALLAECDPYWDNCVLAMHLTRESRSIIACALADGYAVKHWPYFDITENTQESFDGFFGEYGTDAVLSYAWSAGASVEDTGVIATKTLPIDSSLLYRLRAYNASWPQDISNITLEFLDASGNVVAAIKNIKNGSYVNDLFYGTSLSTLSLATKTGTNAQTNGVIEFTDSSVVFTNEHTGDRNNSFAIACTGSLITQVRISDLRASSNYTGGTGAAWAMFHKLSHFQDMKGNKNRAYIDEAYQSLSDTDMLGGRAATFSGNDRVVVDDSTNLTFYGDFAVELQAKTTNASAYYSALSSITMATDSWASGFEIYTNGGYWKADLYDASSAKTTITGPAVTVAKQHISLNRVGTTVKLYVDGVGGTGVTWAHTLNAKGVTIGNAWEAATRGFVGKINEVLMYTHGIRTTNFTPPARAFPDSSCSFTAWLQTQSLPAVRYAHAAALLSDGRVLITGGVDGVDSTPDCYIGTMSGNSVAWAASTSLPVKRHDHTGIRLLDGRILVTGGQNGVMARSESYIGTVSGGSISWVASTNLSGARYRHTATLLSDGRVLITGGNDGYNVRHECYIGTVSGDSITWVASNNLPVFRYRHTATLLPDGRVLITGGHDGNAFKSDCYIGTVSGDSITWVASNNLPAVVSEHTATILNDGSVLIVGGWYSSGQRLECSRGTVSGNSITWEASIDLPDARSSHTSTLLPGGSVLVVGGYAGGSVVADCLISA